MPRICAHALNVFVLPLYEVCGSPKEGGGCPDPQDTPLDPPLQM